MEIKECCIVDKVQIKIYLQNIGINDVLILAD